MSDIEVRMAELFNDSLKERKIVSNEDLNQIISVMGTPEQFGAASLDYQEENKTNTQHAEDTIKTGKRFFRDKDDKVIGGVCSGIAAYWGIEDPIWVRLVIGLLLLSGIGFFPYIILWIIIPAARNSSDRLAMRGEPANVKNIGRIIEDELSEMTDSITQFTDEFISKKKDNAGLKSKINRFGEWLNYATRTMIQVCVSFINIALTIFGVNKFKNS